jgi:hypothetical protein
MREVDIEVTEMPFKDEEDDEDEDGFGFALRLDHSVFSDDFFIYGH